MHRALDNWTPYLLYAEWYTTLVWERCTSHDLVHRKLCPSLVYLAYTDIFEHRELQTIGGCTSRLSRLMQVSISIDRLR